MKKLALILFLCLSTPAFAETTEKGHNYEFLGTVDGCRLFKLDVWGKNVYFAHCPEQVVGETQWDSGTPKAPATSEVVGN